jgi:hypothetical protein
MAEIIPRAKARPPWWLNAMLVISLIFLGAAIGGRIFFKISSADLTEQIEDIRQRTVDLRTAANEDLERRLSNYQTQIVKFSDLLNQRYLTSRIMNFIEETAHPGVLYKEFSINIPENRLQLEAMTQTYNVVGEQLLVFNNDPRVKRVETSNYLRDKEGWITFRAIIEFDPALVRQP